MEIGVRSIVRRQNKRPANDNPICGTKRSQEQSGESRYTHKVWVLLRPTRDDVAVDELRAAIVQKTKSGQAKILPDGPS